MAGKLGKFQMLGFQHWKGLTSDNHLGSIFQMQPQKATNLMVQLLAFNRGKTLDTFLNQFPVREFEDDNEYYWDVIGSSRRNIPLVENLISPTFLESSFSTGAKSTENLSPA